MSAGQDGWSVAGSYYESCNCEAVCPCRRLNGRPGGNSTYGICQFLLSWDILRGKAGGKIIITYDVLIESTGTATLTGLIYDFSGSSYHYNSDFGAFTSYQKDDFGD